MDNIIHEVTKGDFKRSSVPPMTHSVKATKIVTISKPPLQEGSKSELRSDSNEIQTDGWPGYEIHPFNFCSISAIITTTDTEQQNLESL